MLFITITMMGICTTLIGVLPTYAQIGVFAPILLVTLRIIQGLGAGAEISGAGTMLAEYAPKGKRGIISSFVAMGTNCGTLSATGQSGPLCSSFSVKRNCWRGDGVYRSWRALS